MPGFFKLEIVSQEKQIYTGFVEKLFAPGVLGQLEVLVGHASLLTKLIPGPLIFFDENKKQFAFALNGGILEVQPKISIVLADTVIRAEDVDEKAAIKARQLAEQKMSLRAKGEKDIDISKIKADLAFTTAQLRLLSNLKKGGKK